MILYVLDYHTAYKGKAQYLCILPETSLVTPILSGGGDKGLRLSSAPFWRKTDAKFAVITHLSVVQ